VVATLFPKSVKKPKGIKGIMDVKGIVNTVKSYAVHPSPLVHMWMDCLDILGQTPNPGATQEQIKQVEDAAGALPDDLKELLEFSNGSDHNNVAWLPSTDDLIQFLQNNSMWKNVMSQLHWFPFGVKSDEDNEYRVIDSSGMVISIGDPEVRVLASNVSFYIDGFHRLLNKTRDEIVSGHRRIDGNPDPYRSLTQKDLYQETEGGKYAGESLLEKVDKDIARCWDNAQRCFE